MSGKDIAFVVLAAGEGKRLLTKESKPLVPLLGRRLIDFPIQEGLNFFKQKNLTGDIFVITGHNRAPLEKYLSDAYGEKINFANQEQQLGTGHALQCYFNQIPQANDYAYTMIVCADTPLLTREVFEAMYEETLKNKTNGTVVSYIEDNPQGYGRIVHGDQGFKIVEEKDADEDVKKITEVNSALYVVKTKYAQENVFKLDNKNKSGEVYLTDLFKPGSNTHTLCYKDKTNFIGVNTLKHLEQAENFLLERKIENLRKSGVRFFRPETSYIDYDVEIGAGSFVCSSVFIEGKTVIGKAVKIGTGSSIKDSFIGSEVEIKAHCLLDEAKVDDSAAIGPFAHLRPGSDIGKNAKIGNFVEIKKSILAEGVKVSHLSYLGDAEVGENTNIGCGFITCNFDGAQKHKTKIGKNSFIGSDSQTIAPVEIGDESFVASGSTITHSMPKGSFAISRGRQVTKEKIAHRFIKIKK